eukprot:SAG22_NODE_6387_length_863_cov_0.941099_3_plen_31_part_01
MCALLKHRMLERQYSALTLKPPTIRYEHGSG